MVNRSLRPKITTNPISFFHHYLVGNAINMLSLCPRPTKRLSNSDKIKISISSIPDNDLENKFCSFIFSAFLESLEWEEYMVQKEKTFSELHFCPQDWNFLIFYDISWHVTRWCQYCKTLRSCNIWHFQLSTTNLSSANSFLEFVPRQRKNVNCFKYFCIFVTWVIFVFKR